MQKKFLLIANWKMNPLSLKEALSLVSGYKKFKKNSKVDLVIAAPYIYLSQLSGLKPRVTLASQNIFWENVGSYTGEISSTMLTSLRVEYSIVGHSERRKLGEVSADISKKVKVALKSNIVPVLCVGEKVRDERGEYLQELQREIEDSLQGVSRKDSSRIVIAYEPVWAIGKHEEEGMNAPDIYSMTIFIKRSLTTLFGKENAEKIKIIYGGSVGPKNAEEIITQGHVDGFLVGHQSLNPKNFEKIYCAF